MSKMSDPLYGYVPPCEDSGCQFESRCDRSGLQCGEHYESLADWVVDMAIEEAKERRKRATKC